MPDALTFTQQQTGQAGNSKSQGKEQPNQSLPRREVVEAIGTSTANIRELIIPAIDPGIQASSPPLVLPIDARPQADWLCSHRRRITIVGRPYHSGLGE